MDNVKLILGITDTLEDELIEALIELSEGQILSHLQGLTTVPPELSWMTTELTIKKYRKIGSEGLTDEKIDVIQSTFEEDQMAPYLTILNNYSSQKLNRLVML
jgi:hypothetical protein